MADMEITNERINGYPLLKVDGRVVLSTSPQLRKALRRWVRRKASCIMVDVSEVRRMDTSGVATLIECQRDMQEYGGRLLLVGLNSHIGDALSLAGVEGQFEVFADEREAAAALPAE